MAPPISAPSHSGPEIRQRSEFLRTGHGTSAVLKPQNWGSLGITGDPTPGHRAIVWKIILFDVDP